MERRKLGMRHERMPADLAAVHDDLALVGMDLSQQQA